VKVISDGRSGQDAGEARVVDAEADLRERGLRLTGPRHAVLEVVRCAGSHPTAEEFHRLVRRRPPGVSLGTICRNLWLLVGEGLLNQLPGPHARVLSARVAVRTGFSITNHRIELFGRCRECQNQLPGTRGQRRRPVARARMTGQALGESLRRRRREG
jgi:Fe2+ or Zn2+ uptake regulation protein